MLMPTHEIEAAAAPPMVAAPFLEIQGIGKSFGTTQVLDGIDLNIDDGEFVALLGPSGCGKTTLLRILCGIESASTGKVRLRGQDITLMPPAQRGFGVVFQSYALFPNLNAAQNVAYGLRGLARDKREQRVREMLDLVGLAGHAASHPAQLSGGQQQRVALARALAPSPRLVLLDEPLSALDAQVRARLRGEIREICQRLGLSTVMVTHDQDEAMSMADRVVLMHKGRIEQAGTPAELYATPRTPFVAGFVGRMNLWPATVLGLDAVKVGDVALDCRSTPERPAAPGQTVQVGIRPEQLHLLPHDPKWDRTPDQHPLPANTVIATVRSTSFHGPHFSARLHSRALDADLDLDLPTQPGAHDPLRVSEVVRLHLPPAALTMIAAT
jgi:iron(III) transport system ATP-binding protein